MSDSEDNRLPRRIVLGVYLAVLLSGAAGLMYQVAWTRRLASVTSATVTAQAVVLAIFMAGLGTGALLAGRRAASLRRPLRVYAAVEAAAAGLAILSIPLIASSENLRTAAAQLLGSLQTGLWIQLLGLSLFLFVPATLMGASIPLVIEAVERRRPDANRAARMISALYAINTLGAAIGCLVAGFVTVEALGLLRTTCLGALLAMAAALVAVALERPERAGDDSESRPLQPLPSVAAGFSSGPSLSLWWPAAALAGFIGLAIEVVWTRLISLVVLNTVYAFTQVLASVLLGIALGAGISVFAIRRAARTRDPVAFLTRSAGSAALFAALLFVLIPSVIVAIAGASELQLDLASGLSLRGNALLVLLLSPPAALVAALLPIFVAIAGEAATAAHGSQRFAFLYAANTAGSVAGSIIAGFVLLPRLGSAGANALLVALTLGLSFWLLRRASVPLRMQLLWSGAAAAGFVLALSLDLPRAVYEARLEEGTEILDFREGVESDVMVTQDGQNRRRIWINSSWVAGTGGGHRSLGHIPALLVEAPKKALGIALGTGQTFAAVYAHGVEELHCVELDAGVIELSTRWFAEANGRLFERPNVKLHRDDGRAFLRSTDHRFDLIVLEPLQAWTAGTSNLYSREFYRDAKRALAPGGVVAQWIPFYGQDVAETKAMVRAAREVFPEASLWLDDHDGMLVLQAEPFVLDPATIWTRIAERGIDADLARNRLDQPEDLLSLFIMGPRGLEAWQAGAELLTDDRPFIEFAAARKLRNFAYRPILRSLAPLAENPGDYLTKTTAGEAPKADDLEIADRARRIRTAILGERSAPPDALDDRAASLEEGLASTPTSKLVRKRYRNLILEWATGLDRSGHSTAAAQVYRRGLEHSPDLEEAAVNLSLVYARQQRYPLAKAALDRRWRPGPVRDSAMRMLAKLDSVMQESDIDQSN